MAVPHQVPIDRDPFGMGWRNGRIDAGFAVPDLAQRLLARDFRLLIARTSQFSMN
jgi:hypothetical protein